MLMVMKDIILSTVQGWPKKKRFSIEFDPDAAQNNIFKVLMIS